MSLNTKSKGYFIEELEVGMSAEYSRKVKQQDIQDFADVSGDDNPVHLNEEFAKQTMFKGCIAHGILSAAFISTVIGTKLPGTGAIYLGQQLKFIAPVRAGDTVVTTATVTDIDTAKRRITLETICSVDDKPVLQGEALVMVPSKANS